MRVLGVDPGTYKMGVGIVKSEAGDLRMEYCDVLTPDRHASLPVRLGYLYNNLQRLFIDRQPTEVAIEEPFVSRNIKTAIAIGQAQSVAMILAARQGISVTNYAPSQVKQAVTDNGGSSKEQVQEMVRVLLNLDTISESLDASDALAVAICHINSIDMGLLEFSE